VLERLLLGQLPAEESERWGRHLERCSRCAAEAAELRTCETFPEEARQFVTAVIRPCRPEAWETDSDDPIDENARRRFEASWWNGRPEPVERFLPPCGDSRYLPTLIELVQVELELSWKAYLHGWSRPPTVAEYLARFPCLDDPAIVARLSEQEREVRKRYGDRGPMGRDNGVDGGRAGASIRALLTPAQAPDEIGRLGPYRVLRQLGEGGMGMVFLAEDPHLQRSVALKVMRPSSAADGDAHRRFLREARAAGSLSHDHIVTIYQVGEDRGVPFLAMELLQGESLEARLNRERRLPIAEVLRIGREMALGLAAAHDRGLIHRDIKPGNTWLQAGTGRVKLLDFGLARPTDGEPGPTLASAVMGTPAYMSPEQAAGSTVDSRTDLFGLGCVLYQMATGHRPFGGKSVLSVLGQVATHTPPPVRDLNEEAPAALSVLVEQLLAKEPERRPKTAQVVAAELLDIARERGDGRRVEDRPTGPPPDTSAVPTAAAAGTGRRIPRRGLLAVAAGFMAVCLAGFIVIKITDKEGKRTELTVPKGSQVKVNAAGEVEVRLPGEGAAKPPPQIPGASPLDDLDPALIPASERFDWQPRELVAVIGTHQQRHWGEVTSVTVSGDGKYVYSSGQAGVIRRWDAATLDEAGTSARPGPMWYFSVASVPGAGRPRLAACHYQGVTVLDASGVPAPLGPEWVLPAGYNVRHVAVSSDGKRLAYGWERGTTVLLWAIDGDRPRKLAEFKQVGAAANQGASCSFAADGARLAVAEDKEVRIHDLTRPGHPEQVRLPHEEPITHVCFLPIARRLAIADGSGRVALWDLAGNKPKKEAVFMAASAPRSLAMTPDGKRMMVSNEVVQVWDVSRTEPTLDTTLDTGLGSAVATFTSDGRGLITASHGCLRRWRLAGDRAIEDPSYAPERSLISGLRLDSAAMCPDGSRLAGWTGLLGSERCRVWDLTGTKPRVCAPWSPEPARGLPNAFTPDGSTLATYSYIAPYQQLWDVSAAGPRLLDRDDGRLNQWISAFRADGNRAYGFALVGDRWRLRIWDTSAPAWRVRWTAPAGDGVENRGRLSPDGKSFAVLHFDERVNLWDVEADPPRLRATLHQGERPHDAAFSPDSRTFYCGGWGVEGWCARWDIRSEEPRRLERLPAEGPVESLAISAEGRRVAWATDIATCRLTLWDLAEHRPAREWRLPGPVARVFFARDGRHLITCNSNGTAYVLRLATPDGKPYPPGRDR
jgi:WD40 repeat protein/predicted Ser/Thr protein kinase